MKEQKVTGFLGYTEAGQPIVASDHRCIYFHSQEVALSSAPECWYCIFSDFRKSCELVTNQSICHCAENRFHSAEKVE